MKIGEEKNVTLQPSEAYGDKNPQLIITASRDQIQSDKPLEVGDTLMATSSDGRQTTGKVIEATNDTITVDLNHPLAGEVLNFHIKLVEIS